jgi:small subunit ribosomal protein S1
MSQLENTSVVQNEETAPLEEKVAVPEKEDFDRLLNDYSQYSQPPLGTLLRGRVVKIAGSEIIIDVGYKCEGVISAEEFKDREGKLRIQPGDEIDVMMESAEEREGYVVLSRERAKRVKVWDDIESAYEKQSVIQAKVVERIKGGLAVDIGVRAFLPGSQVDVKPVRNLDALIGQEIPCKIIKLNKKRSNIVVSRKVVVEAESSQRKQHTLEQLGEGAALTGTVKNITDYGVFVDLGGIDGLLHVTDLSWGRVGHPSEVVTVGQQLQVKVLKFDREKERVSLGMKQLSEDPWLSVGERYAAGARVTGKVVNLADYGAFIELEKGVEGLIHVSEMSWSKRVKHPSKILSLGQEIETVVLDVNAGERRISLGLKQTAANPWESLPQRYAVGTVIKGRVRNLTDFGAFVEVEEGIDGLVHVSDISWTRKIKHPSEFLKKGEIVQAVVLSIDPENRRLSLGMKQLHEDAWEAFTSRCHLGDVIHGKVVRKASFGVFVELAEGIEGLCHISEFATEVPDKHSIPMDIGHEAEFKILKLNPTDRKIGLTMKLHAPAERVETEKVPQQHSSAGAKTATNTIADMMAMKERNSVKK